MKYTSIRTLYSGYETFLDQEIVIAGWIRTSRSSKTFGFIEVNDGSYLSNLQVVVSDTVEGFSEIMHYNVGAAIIVEGVLVKSQGAKQAFELSATKVTLEGASSPEYPLQKKAP